ncbi:hypothetical protein AB833_16645 [Chromatiales bacterium (ex Bugula neritina AB1)]|nr:hypothetical protein AB833_16645 [Chromatiales bacterium (ex Bugula neritina AB1)]
MSISKTITFSAPDGLLITGTRYGSDGSPPVLLLHGAGQTRHSWGGTASRLAAAGWCAISVDTRGHGDSQWAPDGDYSIDSLLTDLTLIVEEIQQNWSVRPAVVGASLGGITALIAEGECGDGLFNSLVLVDITPSLNRAGVERILEFMRRYSDGFATLDDARRAVSGFQPHRKSGKSQSVSSGLEKNLRYKDGRYYWHWDPRLLDHVSDLDTQLVARQQRACRSLDLPVLLVHGRMSDVVSNDSAREFLQLVPGAQYVNVADAAHMVAGDDNDVFSTSVSEFLRTSQHNE